MTQTFVLTDDEVHLIRKALIDAYHSTTYLVDEKDTIVDLLNDLPDFD